MFEAGFAADPWPALAALRAEGDGVHRVRTPDGPPAWLVTRYADVRAGLANAALSTHDHDARGADYRGFVLPRPLTAHLLNAAPEAHARLRSLVTAELALRRVEAWQPRLEMLVEDVLDAAEAGGKVQVVAALGVPLPARALGDLLGLAGEDVARLRAWAQGTLVDGGGPARDSIGTMRKVIAEAMANPPRGGLVARLQEYYQRGALDEDELVSLLFYLWFVWYEVLMDAIAGGLWLLASQPDRCEWLRAHPHHWGTAVDELLRYLSPQLLAGPRYARHDLWIGTTRIRAGQTVLLGLGAANHDPAVFTDPEVVNLTRQPNPHLGLGHGPHTCAGLHIVRRVLSTLLSRAVARWPGMTPAEPVRAWRSGFRHRGPTEVTLRTGRAAG
ncbi:hypothetical protein SAMN05421810_10941 [Amycolatopsis arida]|uniref:Cytochrome P450 n=1 Tax=Amycolatopsis arida TaxID=587909 RepID=A0A1I5ZCK4_9PSEU|nr:hypothetical protein CLV69_10940 [Amycolatopsis arida]SFQ54155.1 hypothetical protein SAMN05421810_10941 [Amycolatopsis arida]